MNLGKRLLGLVCMVAALWVAWAIGQGFRFWEDRLSRNAQVTVDVACVVLGTVAFGLWLWWQTRKAKT